MIGLSINAAGVGLLRATLRAGVRNYRKAIKSKIREASNVVRRKQRQLLRAGDINQRTGTVRQYNKQKGRVVQQEAKRSRLLSFHKIIIKPAKGGHGGYTEWESFIGPPPGGPAFYGKFLELGVGERRTKDGASRGKIKAMPWMKPSIEAVAPEVERIIASAFRKLDIVGN